MSEINEYMISDKEIDFLKSPDDEDSDRKPSNPNDPFSNVQSKPVFKHTISLPEKPDTRSFDVERNMKGSEGMLRPEMSLTDSNQVGTEFFNVDNNRKTSIGEILEQGENSTDFNNPAWGDGDSIQNSLVNQAENQSNQIGNSNIVGNPVFDSFTPIRKDQDFAKASMVVNHQVDSQALGYGNIQNDNRALSQKNIQTMEVLEESKHGSITDSAREIHDTIGANPKITRGDTVDENSEKDNLVMSQFEPGTYQNEPSRPLMMSFHDLHQLASEVENEKKKKKKKKNAFGGLAFMNISKMMTKESARAINESLINNQRDNLESIVGKREETDSQRDVSHTEVKPKGHPEHFKSQMAINEPRNSFPDQRESTYRDEFHFDSGIQERNKESLPFGNFETARLSKNEFVPIPEGDHDDDAMTHYVPGTTKQSFAEPTRRMTNQSNDDNQAQVSINNQQRISNPQRDSGVNSNNIPHPGLIQSSLSGENENGFSLQRNTQNSSRSIQDNGTQSNRQVDFVPQNYDEVKILIESQGVENDVFASDRNLSQDSNLRPQSNARMSNTEENRLQSTASLRKPINDCVDEEFKDTFEKFTDGQQDPEIDMPNQDDQHSEHEPSRHKYSHHDHSHHEHSHHGHSVHNHGLNEHSVAHHSSKRIITQEKRFSTSHRVLQQPLHHEIDDNTISISHRHVGEKIPKRISNAPPPHEQSHKHLDRHSSKHLMFDDHHHDHSRHDINTSERHISEHQAESQKELPIQQSIKSIAKPTVFSKRTIDKEVYNNEYRIENPEQDIGDTTDIVIAESNQLGNNWVQQSESFETPKMTQNINIVRYSQAQNESEYQPATPKQTKLNSTSDAGGLHNSFMPMKYVDQVDTQKESRQSTGQFGRNSQENNIIRQSELLNTQTEEQNRILSSGNQQRPSQTNNNGETLMTLGDQNKFLMMPGIVESNPPKNSQDRLSRGGDFAIGMNSSEKQSIPMSETDKVAQSFDNFKLGETEKVHANSFQGEIPNRFLFSNLDPNVHFVKIDVRNSLPVVDDNKESIINEPKSSSEGGREESDRQSSTIFNRFSKPEDPVQDSDYQAAFQNNTRLNNAYIKSDSDTEQDLSTNNVLMVDLRTALVAQSGGFSDNNFAKYVDLQSSQGSHRSHSDKDIILDLANTKKILVDPNSMRDEFVEVSKDAPSKVNLTSIEQKISSITPLSRPIDTPKSQYDQIQFIKKLTPNEAEPILINYQPNQIQPSRIVYKNEIIDQNKNMHEPVQHKYFSQPPDTAFQSSNTNKTGSKRIGCLFQNRFDNLYKPEGQLPPSDTSNKIESGIIAKPLTKVAIFANSINPSVIPSNYLSNPNPGYVRSKTTERKVSVYQNMILQSLVQPAMQQKSHEKDASNTVHNQTQKEDLRKITFAHNLPLSNSPERQLQYIKQENYNSLNSGSNDQGGTKRVNYVPSTTQWVMKVPSTTSEYVLNNVQTTPKNDTNMKFDNVLNPRGSFHSNKVYSIAPGQSGVKILTQSLVTNEADSPKLGKVLRSATPDLVNIGGYFDARNQEYVFTNSPILVPGSEIQQRSLRDKVVYTSVVTQQDQSGPKFGSLQPGSSSNYYSVQGIPQNAFTEQAKISDGNTYRPIGSGVEIRRNQSPRNVNQPQSGVIYSTSQIQTLNKR